MGVQEVNKGLKGSKRLRGSKGWLREEIIEN
jgi:hypothetical protein